MNDLKRYIAYRSDGEDLVLDDLRERAHASPEAQAVLELAERDQAARRLPTDELVATAFGRFDVELFDGLLAGRTTVVLDPRLVDHEDGSTKKDGTEIYLSPVVDWEYHLIHEMVHAFEFLYPGSVEVTPASDSLAADPVRSTLHGPHSSEFFAKLLEVMAKRAHGHEWLGVYFG